MVQCIQSPSGMNGHGHDSGHKFLDTETIFFWTSDTDMGRVITSDTGSDLDMTSDTTSDMDSDKVMTSDTDTASDTRVRSSLICRLNSGIFRIYKLSE